MGCVFRRKVKFALVDGTTVKRRTANYFARFNVNGKDYCLSTGKTSKAEAEEELARLMAIHKGEASVEEYFDGLLDLLAKLPEQEREARRHQFARKLMSGQREKLRLADGWPAWLASPNKRRTPKETTRKGYEAIWNRFLTWAGGRELEYFHDVTEKAAHEYAQHLWTSRMSPATFNAHVKFLTGVFALLESGAGLTGNVWRKITRKERVLDQGRRHLSEEELRTVLARAQGNQRVMIALGLFTGLRLGDVVNLRWDEIDHDRFKGELKPGFIVTIPMKTARYRRKVELPITAGLRQALDEHRRQVIGEHLFPQEREQYARNASNVTRPMQELFESCGIKTTEEAANGERRRAIVRVGFHSLRHSFVSLCAKAGAPQHVVQRLVGHGNPAMTEHYTHLDEQQKQDAVAGLPRLMGTGSR